MSSMSVHKARAIGIAAACAALFATPASAAPSPRASSPAPATLWTSDALLPLAVVRAGKLAPFQVCAIGVIEDGSRWRALDAWGRVTGTVRKGTREGADELRLIQGSRGVGVYVRAGGTWTTPPPARWQPNAKQRASFERWRSRSAGRKGAVRFFASSVTGLEFAAIAGSDHLSIALYSEERWRLVHEERQQWRWPLFELRTIVDMTGDGMPEIIYHFNETDDGRGHEVVLAASRDGRAWKQVSDNHDDCP